MNEDEAAQLALKRAELLVVMSKQVNEASTELRALRQTVKENTDARSKDHRNLLWTRLVVLMLLAYLPFQVYLSWENHSILSRVNSATTPGGKIYRQGQASTAKAVQQLQQTSILIAQCQQDHAPDVLVCVTERSPKP